MRDLILLLSIIMQDLPFKKDELLYIESVTRVSTYAFSNIQIFFPAKINLLVITTAVQLCCCHGCFLKVLEAPQDILEPYLVISQFYSGLYFFLLNNLAPVSFHNSIAYAKCSY